MRRMHNLLYLEEYQERKDISRLIITTCITMPLYSVNINLTPLSLPLSLSLSQI